MKTRSSLTAPLLPGFVLISAVFLLRLILDAAHLPGLLVRILSLSAVTPLAIILATILLHSRSQATYSRVFAGSFLLVVWTQLLIVFAILFFLATGVDNIYTAPEFSLPNDPNHLHHIGGHLVTIPFATLVGGGVGSMVLWLLRRVDSNQPR